MACEHSIKITLPLTLRAWSSCLLMTGDQRPKLFALIYCGSLGMTIILKWVFKKAQDRDTWPGEQLTNIQFPLKFGIS
jgi:hypothetical protein